MTHQQLLENWHHVEAFKEDGIYQVRSLLDSTSEWADTDDPPFGNPRLEFRRKPRPTLVPLDASDFAQRLVTWIRCGPCAAALVTNVTDAGIRFDSRHRTYNALRDEGWLWCDRPSQRPEDWKRCEKASP